jgi:hypothetical protein
VIPHRSASIPGAGGHDPKAVIASSAKLVALLGGTCLFVVLILGMVLVGVAVQFGQR